MKIKDCNTIQVESLNDILTVDTTLQRYFPLIPQKQCIIAALLSCGITDSQIYAYACKKLDELSFISGIDIETLGDINALFKFYRFRPRRMSEFIQINRTLTNALSAAGINDSGQYLQQYLDIGVVEMSEKYCVTTDDVLHFACLCDLMRLPGVALARASLYYDSGFRNISAFAVSDYETSARQISAYINESACKLTAPFRKELCTQIVFAKALPKLVD